MVNNRNAERFEDFARIECRELCIVNGRITDISESGFKAEFNAPCNVDSEREYNVILRLSRIGGSPIELRVTPAWSNFDGEKTSIGFSILQSKETARLDDYIKILKADQNPESEDTLSPADSESLFI